MWRLRILLLGCLSALPAAAQTPALDPGGADNHTQLPTVWFQVEWPAANPSRYVVAVDSAGHAAYSSIGTEVTGRSAGDAYTIEFQMSPASTQMVFGAAERLRYFDGKFEFKKRVAFTGSKTLTYADSARHLSTTYNYSDNRDVDALTHLFGGISATMEFDHRLQFMMRYNKLGLYDELKQMLSAANAGWLAELQIVAPTLQAIANDRTVMHVARVTASQILAKAAVTP